MSERTPSLAADDLVLPFAVEGLAVRGRIVRLGASAARALSVHEYPEPAARVLGEALALVAVLGTALKLDATLTLQTRSDGPVTSLVADFRAPEFIRGLVNVDRARLDAEEGDLFGQGSLAFTIDPGGDLDRYQGIVELNGSSLIPAALGYFERSEQIPTLLRVAVGRSYVRGEGGNALTWRVGGIMLQRVPEEGGGGDLRPVTPDDWRRMEMLMATVSDEELLDPMLAPERLAYRLFHEDGVRAFASHKVAFGCRCSRTRVENILKSYARAELEEFVVNGVIRMDCEFCGTHYDFTPAQLDEHAGSDTG